MLYSSRDLTLDHPSSPKRGLRFSASKVALSKITVSLTKNITIFHFYHPDNVPLLHTAYKVKKILVFFPQLLYKSIVVLSQKEEENKTKSIHAMHRPDMENSSTRE